MSQLKRILLGDYYSAARDISRIFFLFGCGGAAEKKNNRTPAERRNNRNSLFFCFFRLKRNLNIKLVITGDDNNAGSQSAAVIGI